jgi:glycosyltransferase involved in cell wall biosynthesis
VNDGSTDGSGALIQAFSDPRIRYIEQPNQGVVAALNAALAMARGEFIARQDADDVSFPERIERQVAFLKANPDVGLLGTWATVTDPHAKPIGSLRHPVSHAAITYALLFDSALVHPTVMFRRSLLNAVGPYSADPLIFEDHAMWNSMVQVTRAANLPIELLRYREVAVSASRIAGREARTVEQRRRELKRFFPQAEDRLVELLSWTGLRHSPVSWKELRELRSMLKTIMQRIGGGHDERSFMRKDAHGRLMGFHLVKGTGLFSRAMDRICKTIALNWP